MKTTTVAFLSLCLLGGSFALCEDDTPAAQRESEWKFAAITLRVGTTLKGLVKDKPGQSVYLDDGSGPMPFDRSSVVKVEDLSEEETTALIPEIAKRREYVARKKDEKRAKARAEWEADKEERRAARQEQDEEKWQAVEASAQEQRAEKQRAEAAEARIAEAAEKRASIKDILSQPRPFVLKLLDYDDKLVGVLETDNEGVMQYKGAYLRSDSLLPWKLDLVPIEARYAIATKYQNTTKGYLADPMFAPTSTWKLGTSHQVVMHTKGIEFIGEWNRYAKTFILVLYGTCEFKAKP